MQQTGDSNGRVILHLVPDDKFIDAAIDQFEICAPGIHNYVMYNRSQPSEVIYVKSLDKIRYAPLGSSLYQQLIVECVSGKFSAVIFHSLPAYFSDFVNKVKGSVILLVMTWATGTYSFINNDEYLPETRAVCQSRRLAAGWRLYREARSAIATNPLWPLNRDLRAILTVDYLCPVIDEDFYGFASKFRRHTIPAMIDFSYGDIDRLAAMKPRSESTTTAF